MIINNRLLSLIDKSADNLSKKWADKVLESEYTKTYRKLTIEEIISRGRDDFSYLGVWIEKDAKMADIGKKYVNIGKARYLEGFPLGEVLFAFHFSKKVLWNHILTEGILTNAMEMYQAMNLILRIYNFYDVASFYLIRGYQEETFIKLSQKKDIDHDNIKDIFPRGSFFYDIEKDEDKTYNILSEWNLFKTK